MVPASGSAEDESPGDRAPGARRRGAARFAAATLILLVVPALAGVAAQSVFSAPRRGQIRRSPGHVAVILPASRPAVVSGHRSRSATPLVTVRLGAPRLRVPRSFLGLSIEYWGLPRYLQHDSTFDRVLSLLRVRGDGSTIVRIGGDSADHAYWDPRAARLPQRAFRLTRRWLAQARALVIREHVRLILDLNLVANSPRMGAQWARAALAALPRGSVVGLEVGNEPDLYHREHWPGLVRIARARLRGSVLSGPFSLSSYVVDFRAYARALGVAAHGVRLVGPSVASPVTAARWLVSTVDDDRAQLGILSVHRYPLSACVGRGSRRFPTLARMLGESTSAGMARTMSAAVRLADRAGLPLRVTELNSVTCGGRRGVSNAFASALWAPDALFELLRAGVDGVNVHMRDDAFNTPFTLTRRGLDARPLLYGLILFARTLGRGAQLLETHVHASGRVHVKVWAVRLAGDRLHVLLINKGRRDANIRLELPARGAATVQRLLAPSARATSGVTLAGLWLGRAGGWQGHRSIATIVPGIGGYSLSLPRFGAAFVSVGLAGAARAPAPAPGPGLPPPSAAPVPQAA
jgi:hypothetical protein